MSSIDALLVSNQNLCSTILECEVHFIFGPPCIERNIDCTDRDDRCERDDPFGEVTHCDSDAVTLLHAVLVHQEMSQAIDFVHHATKCVALTFIEEECLVAMCTCTLQDESQVLWCVFEHFHLHAENVCRLKFEWGT